LADLVLRVHELFAWTQEERGKWQEWFEGTPTGLDLPVQPDGRFRDIGALIS
jgi:hypothetical protein